MTEPTPLNQHEIAHRVRALEGRTDEHSDVIQGVLTTQATMLEALTGIRKAVESTDGKIEWATRLIMGAVLLAVLALVLKEASHSGGAGASPHGASEPP